MSNVPPCQHCFLTSLPSPSITLSKPCLSTIIAPASPSLLNTARLMSLSYMSSLLPTFTLTSHDELYSSVVANPFMTSMFASHTCNVVRKLQLGHWFIVLPRRGGRQGRVAIPLKPTHPPRIYGSISRPETSSWPFSSGVLTESWHQFTNRINRQISVSSL